MMIKKRKPEKTHTKNKALGFSSMGHQNYPTLSQTNTQKTVSYYFIIKSIKIYKRRLKKNKKKQS